jgi:hypothetical protein
MQRVCARFSYFSIVSICWLVESLVLHISCLDPGGLTQNEPVDDDWQRPFRGGVLILDLSQTMYAPGLRIIRDSENYHVGRITM